MDEKITLIDGVKVPFTDEMMRRISSVVDPAEIDVVVCNHVEMDHSGALPAVMAKAVNATMYCTPAAERELKMHYDAAEWKIQTVKSNDTLNIGKHTLTFVQMPMVHWPDSMMTYVGDEKLLFPNDGFGQHYASDGLFDDENTDIVLDEAKKYYGNIVMPYGAQVQKVLEIAAGLDIEMIAPSHGVIWREHISEIVEKYKLWSSYGSVADKAVVVYDTMWESTERMAQEVADAWSEKGLRVNRICLKHTNMSDAINALVEAKYVALGSPALNSGIMPTMGGFLTYLKGLAAKNKIGFCFGSYGWKKDCQQEMQDVLTKMGWTMPEPISTVNWRPTEEALALLRESAARVVG